MCVPSACLTECFGFRYLYPVPREDTSRVMTYANEGDYISFRHHTFVKKGKDVELTEVGPRFEMRPYQVRLP